MHTSFFAATLLAAAPLALAQSGMTTAPSATPTASGAPVVTMMWDNEPTAGAGPSSGSSMAAGMSGMSMGAGAVMTMSNGEVMTGMSGMSGMMSTATGTAMAGMNMTGSAGRLELAPGAMGVGWVVISIGAGVGFLAGLL
ncbi:hypothetical protein SVAN01_04902 [Stagonosporopsis vannaccii]|nr:hypothetical protein SVAN01_04902 [Stagonosporopsis vannaccii]